MLGSDPLALAALDQPLLGGLALAGEREGGFAGVGRADDERRRDCPDPAEDDEPATTPPPSSMIAATQPASAITVHSTPARIQLVRRRCLPGTIGAHAPSPIGVAETHTHQGTRFMASEDTPRALPRRRHSPCQAGASR